MGLSNPYETLQVGKANSNAKTSSLPQLFSSVKVAQPVLQIKDQITNKFNLPLLQTS